MFTAAESAARLGIDRGHLCRLAIALGIDRRAGKRARLFTEAELRRIDASRKPPGRPRKG